MNDQGPPPLPPRDPDMLLPPNLYEDRRKILPRRGSEHSLLSLSMSVGSGAQKPLEKQLSIKKSGKDKKAMKKLEEISLKNKKKNKKSDTFSGRATPTTSSALSSPARTSSILYFPGSSPSHNTSVSCSASFNDSDLGKSPKRSKWNMIRKVGRKIARSPSIVDQDDVKNAIKSNKPQRSQSIPAIRNCGIYTARSVSITAENGLCGNLTDGGGMISPRIRRGSTSQNDVTIVSKIFSILTTWVEDYFEVCVTKEV